MALLACILLLIGHLTIGALIWLDDQVGCPWFDRAAQMAYSAEWMAGAFAIVAVVKAIF